MLIIFGGLPGTGKTTISRKLAEKIGAVYLRIDTIETAMAHSDLQANNTNAGYLAAYGIAHDNLLIGCTVVADSVNSTQITREAWRHVAQSASANFIEIEAVCSDASEHQKRIETRPMGESLFTTTWQKVLDREYEDWKLQGIRVDTAQMTLEETIEKILASLTMFKKPIPTL